MTTLDILFIFKLCDRIGFDKIKSKLLSNTNIFRIAYFMYNQTAVKTKSSIMGKTQHVDGRTQRSTYHKFP